MELRPSEISDPAIIRELIDQRLKNISPDGLPTDERELLIKARGIVAVPQEIVDKTAKIAQAVAQMADLYDMLIVGGSSRSVPKTLLQAAGVSPSKVISFDEDTNAASWGKYKYVGISLEEKVERITHALRASQTQRDFPQNPAIAIVDDRAESGDKAFRFLEVLSQLDFVSDFGFIVFSAPVYTRNGKQFVGRLHDQKYQGVFAEFKRPDLADRFHFPTELNTGEYQDHDIYISRLQYLASRISPYYHDNARIPQDSRDIARIVLRSNLAMLDRTIRNTAA